MGKGGRLEVKVELKVKKTHRAQGSGHREKRIEGGYNCNPLNQSECNFVI
jgi:hypothetical protein